MRISARVEGPRATIGQVLTERLRASLIAMSLQRPRRATAAGAVENVRNAGERS